MIYTLPHELKTGGRTDITDSAITVTFDDIRYSLSSGPLNGGFHHTLGVRNQKLTLHIDTEKDLPGGSASAYLAKEMAHIGVPVDFATALLTSAQMNEYIYYKEEVDDIIIEVIVTAGFDHTAHRAGDGYFYKEQQGEFILPGTINMLIFTNKALTDGAMVRALITITEAKSVALAEKNIRAVHSSHVASGTATDGVIFTITPQADVLTDAGTFSQFGDTLAKAVKTALQLHIDTYQTK